MKVILAYKSYSCLQGIVAIKYDFVKDEEPDRFSPVRKKNGHPEKIVN
jgi:hypothetical protein